MKTFLVKGIRQKIACCVIPSMEYPRKGKTPVTESSSVVTSGWILGRIWLPRGVRELEGWWNYSMFWLWCWMNDCMLNTEEMNLGKLMTDMLRMTTLLPSWGFHTWISTSREGKSLQWPWDTLSNVRNHVGTYMKDHYTVLEENHPHGHTNFSGQHWTLEGHTLLADTPTDFSRVAKLHKLNTDCGQAQQKMKVVN